MRVGIVTEWFERGSAYVSKEYERQLLASGAEVFIYSRAEHVRINQKPWVGQHVHFGKYSGYPAPKAVDRKDFLQWLEKIRPDIVIFNEQQWIQPIRWVHALGIPAVAYVDYYTRRSIREFSLYDGLICNTKRHMQAMGAFNNKLFIPWGTNVQVFKPRSDFLEVSDFFHSYGWGPERKGTDLVILALMLLPETYSLTLHGQVSLRAAFPQLKNEIDKLEREGRVRIIERTETAPGLYHMGRVYVYPSRLDGLGLTVAEALSCGLPIVVTEEPPMSEFASAPFSKMVQVESYRERSDGYYWPEANVNVKDLARQMKVAADNALEDWSSTSRAVRDWSVEHLDSSKNFTTLYPYLREVISGSEHRSHAIRSRLLGLKNLPLEIVGRFWRRFLKL